jgi:hypothetical protein
MPSSSSSQPDIIEASLHSTDLFMDLASTLPMFANYAELKENPWVGQAIRNTQKMSETLKSNQLTCLKSIVVVPLFQAKGNIIW